MDYDEQIQPVRAPEDDDFTSSVPRIHEEYTTQLYEECGRRVKKKVSLEFSLTQDRIAIAVTKLN